MFAGHWLKVVEGRLKVVQKKNKILLHPYAHSNTHEPGELSILRVPLRCKQKRNELGCVVGENMQEIFNVAAPTTVWEVAISSRFIIFSIVERVDLHKRYHAGSSEIWFVCCCCSCFKAGQVATINTLLVRFDMLGTDEQNKWGDLCLYLVSYGSIMSLAVSDALYE